MRDKVAFLTGAGGFIGRKTALTLAKEGIAVAVSDIDPETTENTVKQIVEQGGKAKAYVVDVKKSADIDGAIRQAFADFGGLDIMVHLAGGSARENNRPLVEQTDEVIHNTIGVNLMGGIYASRTAAQLMIQQGTGGRIINIASTVGVNGLVGLTDYAAAKSGIMGFTKALAKELGQYQITVNAVAPGVVARVPEDDPLEEESFRQYVCGTNLLGRRCMPGDVANLVEFLVSDRAGFITGQTYIIDGGRSLSMKGTD